MTAISGSYRYAVEEELREHSPAAHIRRPRLDYESHATGLDRNELGALLVAAGLGPAAERQLARDMALIEPLRGKVARLLANSRICSSADVASSTMTRAWSGEVRILSRRASTHSVNPTPAC